VRAEASETCCSDIVCIGNHLLVFDTQGCGVRAVLIVAVHEAGYATFFISTGALELAATVTGITQGRSFPL